MGSGAGLSYLTGFLGFHECVQKLVHLERNFFVLTKGKVLNVKVESTFP